MPERIAILFDIDGTLIITGGAGAKSWRLAFDELYGIPADIGEFTDTGMTDPDVGRKTFEAVLHRKPERKEFTRLLEHRLHYLHQTVAESDHYRVLAGMQDLLPKLIEDGYLLGIVTAISGLPRTSSSTARSSTVSSPSAATALTRPIAAR
jgi:phosphoglycolate phosphatase